MAHVAIVTGGTRGIGEAISVALKTPGMTVVANYAGNEEKARAFTDAPASRPTNGTSATTTRAIAGCSRSTASSARSTCWSTTPASPATARC